MSVKASDRGSAVVEFIVIGVGILVPVVFVLQTLATVHGALLASGQAARASARAFATAATLAEGRQRAQAAARLALADHGFDLPPDALALRCTPTCLAPGSTVIASLDWPVPTPWLPVDWWIPVTVSATQQFEIDDLRSGPDGSGP